MIVQFIKNCGEKVVTFVKKKAAQITVGVGIATASVSDAMAVPPDYAPLITSISDNISAIKDGIFVLLPLIMVLTFIFAAYAWFTRASSKR